MFTISHSTEKHILQIAEILMENIDYIYKEIFPDTSYNTRIKLLTKLISLQDENNFLSFKYFYNIQDQKDQLIGIIGLITIKKISFGKRFVFFLRSIKSVMQIIPFVKFLKFLFSLYRNRDLFTSDINEAGYITYIIVKNTHQNKGIGSKLISFSFEHFKSLGCKEVSLVVRSKNYNAIDFFTKKGFVEIKRKQDRFISLGEKVIMKRFL